jgi:cytochrome c2
MKASMPNRLYVPSRTLRLAGAGLVLMLLGPVALAQNAVNGRKLYEQSFCSACHDADPSGNRNNVRNGANNPAVILAACASQDVRYQGMFQICGGFSFAQAADLAAFIANPKALGPSIDASVDKLVFRRAVNNNASPPQKLTVANNGDAQLLLASMALAGANPGDYALRAPAAGVPCANGLAIAPKASCSVDVVFQPTAVGARNAALLFTPDAATGLAAVSVALDGTGTAVAEPAAAADAAALNFGGQVLNTASGAKALRITNSGDANLAFDAANAFVLSGANADEYAIDGGTCTAGGTLAADGASCTVQIRFTPKAAGSRSASLTIGSNGEDLVVGLSGAGVAAGNDDDDGGCSMVNADAAFDPVLLSLFAGALAVLGGRRRRR